MGKFSRNKTLQNSLAVVTPRPNLVEANTIPKPNAKNIQGHSAYALDKWLRLISMLNTLKLENQFYRSENQTMKDLKVLIDECAKR